MDGVVHMVVDILRKHYVRKWNVSGSVGSACN